MLKYVCAVGGTTPEGERVLVQRVSRRAGMSGVPVRQLVSVRPGVLSVSEDSLGTP